MSDNADRAVVLWVEPEAPISSETHPSLNANGSDSRWVATIKIEKFEKKENNCESRKKTKRVIK